MMLDNNCLGCEKLLICPWVMKLLYEAFPPNLHMLGKPFLSKEGIVIKRKNANDDDMVVREGNYFTKKEAVSIYFSEIIPIAHINYKKSRPL